MEHEATLISTTAAGFGLAMIFGFLAVRLKLPPLVGYLVAGIAIGPYTRGFVGDVALAGQLAEIGVMLLMFGVGLHFSLDDLKAVRGIALPGAVVQILVSTAIGTATAMLWGWSFGAGLVLGLALSVASTVVLLKALEARGALETFNGRIAVGWLIVQVLVMVIVLVLLPPLAPALGGAAHGSSASLGVTLVITFAKAGAFVALMLIDPSIVVRAPLALLAILGIVMIGNTLAAFVLVLLFRYPLNTALTVAAGLAQIGEFSFILARIGVTYRLLSEEGQSLILAAAILSIALNPVVFAAVAPAQRWIRARRSDPLAELPSTVDAAQLTGHVAIVGYGRVGRRIADALRERNVAYTVAEQNRELVESRREEGIHAVSGDARDAAVLIQAHVARAAMLVIATPDPVGIRKMIDVARKLNPRIEIVLRTHSDEEAMLLREENAGAVFMGEHELAKAMTQHVLSRFP